MFGAVRGRRTGTRNVLMETTRSGLWKQPGLVRWTFVLATLFLYRYLFDRCKSTSRKPPLTHQRSMMLAFGSTVMTLDVQKATVFTSVSSS